MPRTNQAIKPRAPSPAARSILQLKRIYGRRPLNEWRALLAEVAAIDRTSEPLVGPARRKIFGFLFLAAVFAVAATFFIYVAVLSVVSAGMAGFYLVRWWRLRSTDLSNDFRNVLLKFLRIMAEDIPAKGRISMLVDVSGPTKQKLIAEKQLPPGRCKKIVEKVYSDPWCHMQAPLSNGSRMLLGIENRYTVQQRTWTNPRGKTKSKTKWKKLVKVTVGLIPDPERLCFDRDRHDLFGR